jgi:sugar lactone lactonase YvrE
LTIPHPLSEIPRTVLGEGPYWDGQSLLYVDIKAGQIHRHSLVTHTHDVLFVGSTVGFAVLDEDQAVIAGVDQGAILRLRFDSLDLNVLAQAARENPHNLANDGKCDRRGRLWCGTKNRDETAAPTGSLTRFDGGPCLTEILHPVFVSNGLAWSPDNTRMYYSESTDKVWIFDYDIASGQATNQRAFADLPNDGAVPDGMTVDSQGFLYVAMWGGSRVDVYRNDKDQGTLIESIPVLSALQVSSVAFGGQDLRTLFITTAAVNLTAEQHVLYPDSGLLFALHRSVPGLLETPFRG